LVALALLLLAVGGISFYARRGSPFDDLWRPLIQGGEPVIVSNPSGGTPRFLVYPQNVEEFQRALRAGTSPLSIPSGEIAVSDQMVSVGNMQAILAIAGLLREHRKGALPRIASEFVPGDNRDRPMILVGAFSNAWTLDLSAAQRFRFFSEGRGQQYQAGVLDSSSSRRWYAQLRNHAWEASLDYAVISRVWNSYGQVVLSVAGVTHLGTQAAAEFITNAHSWSELVRGAPRGWQKKNFQILLETKIVGKSANAPKVVEFHLW